MQTCPVYYVPAPVIRAHDDQRLSAFIRVLYVLKFAVITNQVAAE